MEDEMSEEIYAKLAQNIQSYDKTAKYLKKVFR